MPAKSPLLLSLPEDVLRAILSKVMEPIDKLYSPLSAGRELATLAQTSTQLRALVLRFLPVRESMGSTHASLHPAATRKP